MVDHLPKYYNWKHFIVNKRILMMTLLHWIEHLPNLRFHHRRIQISTPLIVSHGYFSFLCLDIKQLKSQQFLSPVLSLHRFPSVLHRTPHLRCRDAEMLCKALQEANLMFLMSPHPQWAACWLVSELVAKKGQRIRDAVQRAGVGWWRRRWGGGWIARSCSLFPDAPGRMDTFDCCTDAEQMLDSGMAGLSERYLQQTRERTSAQQMSNMTIGLFLQHQITAY